jgi:hypothetical protein
MIGHLNDTVLEILLSLRGRPPRNELIVLGTKGTGRLDLFHGYCSMEPGRTSRASKILLPFRYGVSLLMAAGGNLIRRGFRGEYAYPGLRQLIGQFYRSIQENRATPIREEEILEIARFVDRILSIMDSNANPRGAALPQPNPASLAVR